ncbi:MAG: DUF2062 domain-containing protein [Bacteroidales bacterium]|nr:DUF2062 domain-containing protein [Bacteroidales bacterium]
MKNSPYILQEKFDKLGAIVLIPTYNNAPKLEAVIRDVLQYTHHVLIINDGSTDQTPTILHRFNDLNIIHLEKNSGKGKAMQVGFQKAVELNYQYAITIDSDGQHLAKDLEVFLNKIEEHKGAMIVGARDMEETVGVPGGSSFGHKFSNFWFRLETGKSLPDTQSGYRLYPLEAIKDMRFVSNRYEFEIESLVRLSWKGVEMLWVPIDVEYPEDRITHFRKFWDFFRISILNSVLVMIAFLWIKPRDLYYRIRRGELKEFLLNEVLKTQDSNRIIAISIGFGFFMGIFPVWGFQMLIAVAIAIPLKLNKAIVLIAANISIPPLIPFIIYFSFLTGGLLLGQSALPEISSDLSFDDIKDDLIQYYLGAVVLATILGLSTALVSWILMSKWRKETR